MALDTYAGASHFATDENYEVQRSNHFEISLDLAAIGLGGDNANANSYSEAIRLCCTEAPIPRLTINPIDLRHGNEVVHVAGSPSWESTNIRVYDVIGRDMARLLQDWFFRIFNPNTHTMGLVTSYKTTATLFQYSPDASVVRAWTLYGVFPTSFDFGQGNAEQSQAVLISMTLAVDKAILK